MPRILLEKTPTVFHHITVFLTLLEGAEIITYYLRKTISRASLPTP